MYPMLLPFFPTSKNSQGQDLIIINNAQQKQKAESKTCKEVEDRDK